MRAHCLRWFLFLFVASAKAVQIGHAIDGENEIGCMICGIAWYPATCNPADILLAEHQREGGIFYCGDVQVMGEYPTYADWGWATDATGPQWYLKTA